MHPELDIAMEWDGETKTAKLHFWGLGVVVLSGKPNEVQRVFDRLNTLRDEKMVADAHLRRIKNFMEHELKRILPEEP